METLKMVAQCVQSIINFKFKFNEHNFFLSKKEKNTNSLATFPFKCCTNNGVDFETKEWVLSLEIP